ncbi:kynurenine 3-monooxygenase, mitochondrial precursor [Dimargaris verticillata]|uniref:Kynurenine 3-monooxygenase n=1 Tax=Dimargaris verticillata TaxID=2761393 RepID=A0A9W8EER6_9FUNG|nr:kynurenine 3-monooxygenase, mitochondrial precursor [Dimargaris verticillata]
MEEYTAQRRVCIVGAGLVGALASVYFAQRGWHVDVFDTRPDPRVSQDSAHNQQRSINLAISTRGITALKQVGLGLAEEVLQAAIPMHGRMIHGLTGHQSSQAYGVFGQCINSFERKRLNISLLDAAESFSNVTMHFGYTLRACDLDQGAAKFEVRATGQEYVVTVDLIVGADGAYSTCRRQLMRRTRMDYSQTYISHDYCELTIPARQNEHGEQEYAMDPNHLHIWPRHTFMMIALPNKDRTFTCTLFMPKEQFEAIATPESLLAFYQTHFPDAIALIGRDQLTHGFFANPRGALMSVKCTPYHYQDKMVILGDAAHCMVPFYGQGMNCGFEDIQVLFRILDELQVTTTVPPPGQAKAVDSQWHSQMQRALDCYTRTRHRDAVAICDLAMYNYIEMRSSVVSWQYLFRKKLEDGLHKLFPSLIIPLYTMVSFTQIPYHKAIERHERQTRWLTRGLMGVGVVTTAALAALVRCYRK